MYSFDDIKGNEQIIKNIRSMLLYKKISHAYIIDAPKGMGKKLIANVFAKALQCENACGGDIKPCGKCRSCKTFDSGNHTDVIYVKAGNGRSIGVDDVREQIGKNIELKPYGYPYKIFIVDSADTMTVQAQNALLKTIEEPPYYGIFILLSSNSGNFLPTVLSRCVMLKLKPLKFNVVLEYLKEHLDENEEKLYIYASYAQGNIGRGMEIAQTGRFIEMRDMIIKIIGELDKKDLTDIFLDASLFENYKDDIQQALDIMYLCYRDIIVIKCFGDLNDYVIQKDEKDILKNVSESFSYKKLFYGTKAVFDAKRQIKQNANFQMTMEMMLLKLKENR